MKLRKFIRGEQFFFQMLDDDGGIILSSQAYTSKDARDNGVESVKSNIGNADRYEIISEDGKEYFILKAGNGQEIARSEGYDDRASLDAVVTRLQGGSSETEGATAKQDDGGEAYQTDGKSDDYKPLAFYESRITGVNEGFESFEGEGEYYFTYNLDGLVYLISEGYKTEKSRDNGISSVERNMGNRDRYQIEQHPNGKYYFNLRAGNNQEIATSRWFDSAGERDGIVSKLAGGTGGTGTGNIVAANRIASVKIDAPPPAEPPKEKKKRKKRTTAKKPKVEKVYLSDGSYPINNISYQLFRSGNGKHYFTFKNSEGKTILLNSDVRGFETPELGQAKIDQVLKYGLTESNYEGKMTKNGKYYFYLKGDDGKNIAKSFFFNTEEDMQVAIGSLLGDAAAAASTEPATEPTVEKAAITKDSSSKGVSDDYLSCDEFILHLHKDHEEHGDFITFMDGGEFHFAWVGEGNIVLRSEGYTTEKARDNGIESVKKNRENEDRFSVIEEGGKYYCILKAGNHQEIGRSCPYDDEASAKYWYPSAVKKREEEAAAKAAELEKSAAAALAEHKSSDDYVEDVNPDSKFFGTTIKAPESADQGVKDDYLPCEEFVLHLPKGHEEHDDFITFMDGGEYHFAWVGEGNIVLRSEGYTTEKARDNGIESVKKNREIEERFSVVEEGGKYYLILKAGNHQEIGRSCPYDDADAAKYWYPSAVKKREEERAAAEAESKKAALAAMESEKEVEAPAAAAVTETKVKSKKVEDDYLHCKYYKGHPRSEQYPDFSLFEEEGEYYFAMLDADGDVKLRSEGYKSPKGRENGIKSVIKNREIEGRYSVDEKGGKYYVVLKAGNHQEIGRSCPYDDEGGALGFIAPAAAAVAAVAAIPDAKPKAALPEDKEDDYLACKEYENRDVNDKKNNVALFKHENGQFYFAMYDSDGDVKLRSEGFRTAQERDQELSGVLKYHDDEDMYKRERKGSYFMDILYDKTGREVGRSCLQKEKKAAPIAAAAATTAAAVAATATPPPPPPKKVVEEKAAPVAAATSSGGGFNWWWLLPLLLLIPLLWFLMRGCGGDTPPPPPPPPVKVEAPAPEPAPEPEPVKAETPPPAKPEPKPEPTPVTGCNCSAKNIAIFNIPTNKAPKVLERLGTYPEFGDSHGLSPTQFLDKLRNRYANSIVDKTYLDYVFRSMGYSGGFSDARGSMFSDVTLKAGQLGLLGGGKQHHFEYSRIPDNQRDRRAFKIKAANGCDIHFMKTCGNYMFFCD